MEKENAYDAIVAGAGPSGSACAALLSQSGARVLLLDKAMFPRDKPCGDAIGGKALNVIAKLGLEPEMASKGFARSSGLVFSSPCGHEVEIPLAHGAERSSSGYVCERRVFDNLVFLRAKKSCEAIEGAEVTDVIFDGGRAVGVKAKTPSGEKEFFAKVIIGADGANSVVARKTGCAKILPRHTCSAMRGYYSGISGLRGNVEIHFLPECMPGYFWIFPLSKDRANVGVGMLVSDISSKKINLSRVLEACLKNPRFAGRFDSAKLDGEVKGWSLPLASARRRCAGNGFVLLGDAASLIDPFSGEGIGNGMKSASIAAEALAPAIARGNVLEADCLEYEKRIWADIGADVETSYSMQKLGSQSWLLDMVVGKAKKSGWIRDEFAAMIASREAKRKAADPLFYLRILLA